MRSNEHVFDIHGMFYWEHAMETSMEHFRTIGKCHRKAMGAIQGLGVLGVRGLRTLQLFGELRLPFVDLGMPGLSVIDADILKYI